MPSADWYFDFVSPFSYLQCEQLPALERSLRVRYRPVLFAGLLKAHDTVGPAEIPAKRRFTYRFVVWQAPSVVLASNFRDRRSLQLYPWSLTTSERSY